MMRLKDKFEMDEFLNGIGNVYYKAEDMKVSRWSGFDDWQITDTTNALATGKTCVEYSLKSEHGEHGNLLTTNFIEAKFGNDLKALWAFCEALEIVGYDPVVVEGVAIYRREVKGVRMFSPYNLGKVKPLKALPKKWTLRHVYAALINGQFRGLNCKGVYTDDYAWDDAVNYKRGEIKAPLEFVKRIIENTSGWGCDYRDGKVAVFCHTFDNNEFVPVIK